MPSTNYDDYRRPPLTTYLKRLALIWGGILFIGLILTITLWKMFVVWVEPQSHLIIIAKNGAPLDSDAVLAKDGQKGIQEKVYGEGWHFVLPIVYTYEIKPNTLVKAGEVGIVTARGGKQPTGGRVLAEEGEKGIQRQVLPPGSYRLNLYGYDVKKVPATEIPPGYVGVLRRKLGVAGTGRFAAKENEMGFLREILQPGLYYLNTEEFEIMKSEVGIFQTTFHYDKIASQNTSINFTGKGGLDISMDCTVEWEVRPEDMPMIVAEYGSRRKVEENIIKVQAKAIGRDKGIEYSAQDFLEGTKREKFQQDFTDELTKVCKDKNVHIGSAFIRNIVIPENYLKPIRDKQIAVETEETNKAKEETAQIVAEVEREQQMVEQERLRVEADTMKLVAAVDQEVKNVATKTEAEVDKLKAEYQSKIAALDAEKTRLLGQAEAESQKLQETAKSSIYQMKMEVFQGDANAYLRYSMAEKLNEKLVLRLFQSGPGTFWTNMEGKNMQLMIPAPTGAPPANPAAPKAKGATTAGK